MKIQIQIQDPHIKISEDPKILNLLAS